MKHSSPRNRSLIKVILIAIAGIPMAICAGIIACAFWWLMNFGVTFDKRGEIFFILATKIIFCIASVVFMGIWLAVFEIWPFKQHRQ